MPLLACAVDVPTAAPSEPIAASVAWTFVALVQLALATVPLIAPELIESTVVPAIEPETRRTAAAAIAVEHEPAADASTLIRARVKLSAAAVLVAVVDAAMPFVAPEFAAQVLVPVAFAFTSLIGL